MGARRIVCFVALLFLTWSSGVASAQSTISTDVGLRSWFTSGYTKFNFEGGPVVPISELRWRGTDVLLTEGNVDFVWRRLVLSTSLGGGYVSDGTFIDDDFFGTDYQARFSHTRSEVSGHVFYGIGDVGFRAYQWHEPMSGTRGFVDLFVGYQYWEEKYKAWGLQGFFGVLPFIVPEGQALPQSVKGITHSYWFHSLRVGVRAVVPLGRGFAWRLSAAALPYTSATFEDIHHLRPDFAQDPTGRTRADGGFGYDIDTAVSYRVWRGLSAEVGYKFRGIEAGRGTLTQFFSDGTTARTPVPDLIIRRGGPYVGVQYRF